jgi:pilus assembly protein Flp/PilA
MFDILNSLIVAIEIRRQQGQGMVEYGLILAVVSVVAIAALQLIGTDLTTVFNGVAGKLVAPAAP